MSSEDTGAELVLRRVLWKAGARYRLHVASLPGKPDIVLPGSKLAVFVDGDFWHGYQWTRRGLSALEDQFRRNDNRDYWLHKIRRNIDRDARITNQLIDSGWKVVRFWESEVISDSERCASMVMEAMRGIGRFSGYGVVPRRTFAEFFAGIGLVRMGLERQGWAIAYANDIDEEKRDMYKGHYGDPDERFDLGDVHNVDPDSVPRVTLATASFPCNDLSLAGAREGLSGSQSSAFWGFVRILSGMQHRRPPMVMLENVPGFLTSHGGSDLQKALRALTSLGYTVDAFLLDAASFVPQSRLRLFVIGLNDPDSRVTGAAAMEESTVRPPALCQFAARHPELAWKSRRLPDPPVRGDTVESILEDIPEDSTEWWSAERATYLLEQMSERHRAVADLMISRSVWSYGTVFRRVRNGRSMAELRTDGTAGCLRTPRGGSGRQILFKAGNGRYMARLLTPRECARLMGADDYRITVAGNPALFGFGDAVCVPVIEWIAKYYLNPVANEMIHGGALEAGGS